MADSILNSPGPGYVFEEGEYGGVWVEKEKQKVNPYASAKKISTSAVQAGKKASRFVHKKSAPDEKGYTWSMGYNNLVGRYTQGNLFPELSGSSLNRKGHAKDIPASDDDIVEMADKAAYEYARSGGDPIVSYYGEKRHVYALKAEVDIAIASGDRGAALRLALWLSASLRKLSRSLSYGLHVLSTRSRGKIKDKATAFFRSCPGDRVFGTFSFIAPVDDRTGQVVLNKFLTQARKKYPGLQYFWVAERQTGERNDSRGVSKEATGNVHFHMILNKRLPVGKWNAMWVIAQYNSGLRGHDQWGNEISLQEILRLYALDVKEKFAGIRGRNGKKISRIQDRLNPLDLKKVKSIGKLSGYLTKYITKQEKNQPFACSVWHCSRGVSRLFTRQTVGPSAFAYMKSFANYGVDRTTGEVWAEPMEYKCGNGFAVVIFANNKAAPLRYMKRLEQVNKWVLGGHEIDRLPMLDDDLFKRLYICKN